MLFGAEPIGEAIQAIQTVALAGIGAWVAVTTRRINAQLRETELRVRHQASRLDSLENDVEEVKAHSGVLKHKPHRG